MLNFDFTIETAGLIEMDDCDCKEMMTTRIVISHSVNSSIYTLNLQNIVIFVIRFVFRFFFSLFFFFFGFLLFSTLLPENRD